MLNAKLSHVALGADDPEHTRRFYEDRVGLRTGATGPSGSLRMGLGAGAHVLELLPGGGLDHYALELAGEPELAELVDRITKSGVEVQPVPSDKDHPHAVTFIDPDNHRIEIHARLQRRCEANASPRHRPSGLHHITLSTADVPTLVDFYVSTLGFAVSDKMGDSFAWLRCNREHHTVAIVQGPPGGLDHYCYEVRDWNELKVWCDELAAGDVAVSWGPGRHGPGNNLFIMFDDPDGVHIELSCEMERFWDGVAAYAVPREWESGMRTVNLWGPAPEWRKPLESARGSD